jgi:hypothetical protein
MRSILIIAAATLALAACNRSESVENASANSKAGDAQGQAPPAAASSDMVAFAEFDRACSNLTDLEKLNADAEGAGWKEYDPEAASEAGKILKFAQANVTPLLGGAEFNNWIYRKQAGGRELVMVVTEIPSGPAQSAECRVYDFAATQPPTEQVIAQWTRTPPSERVSEQGVTAFQWKPGFRDNLTDVSVVYMSPDSPLRQQIPGIGLGIAATLTVRPAS